MLHTQASSDSGAIIWDGQTGAPEVEEAMSALQANLVSRVACVGSVWALARV